MSIKAEVRAAGVLEEDTKEADVGRAGVLVSVRGLRRDVADAEGVRATGVSWVRPGMLGEGTGVVGSVRGHWRGGTGVTGSVRGHWRGG